MNKTAWRKFSALREQYRDWVETLARSIPKLRALQQELVNRRDGPPYTVETPVVYNGALDEVGPDSEIRLILVADNPGRREQAAENRRYLVGPSGKIAEKFFRDHPELGIDFRKNVIILNKTPIHTPRTGELRELCRLGDAPGTRRPLSEHLAKSQEYMARLLWEFHQALSPIPVWITGYSEMTPRGIFWPYTAALQTLYPPTAPATKTLFFYRHFSMNQFTIDLHRQATPHEPVPATLTRTGTTYRHRILDPSSPPQTKR
jgi:hypothetical protein